jgi:hypothetical protein
VTTIATTTRPKSIDRAGPAHDRKSLQKLSIKSCVEFVPTRSIAARARRMACDKLPYACAARGGGERRQGGPLQVCVLLLRRRRRDRTAICIRAHKSRPRMTANADPPSLDSAGISGSNCRGEAVHGLVTPAVNGCAGITRNEAPSIRRRYPGTGIPGKKTGAANRSGPAFVTEILMSLSRRGSITTPLFPKEQVPASTPIPPRGRDHLSLAQSWLSVG